jgi:hypothetical protein
MYPGYGDAHGFDLEFDTPTDDTIRRHLCAYAINVATGTPNTLLGCRDYGAIMS